MTFNDTIRRLSAARPIEKPSQMPTLENVFGMATETVEHFAHSRGLGIFQVRGISEPHVMRLDSLYLIPSADRGANQSVAS